MVVVADRTSKGIGVVEASPLYSPLPGFERLVDEPDALMPPNSRFRRIVHVTLLKIDVTFADQREISDVAFILLAAVILPGPRLTGNVATTGQIPRRS